MSTKRRVAQKSLAVTLALAIGLITPSSAWSQTYGARASAVTPVAGAQSAAAVGGVSAASGFIPTLSAGSLNLTAAAPVLSAPAALSMSLPVALPSAQTVAAKPVSASVAVRPSALPALSSKVSAAPSAESQKTSGRAQLESLDRAAGKTSADTGDANGAGLAQLFDGSHFNDYTLPTPAAGSNRKGRSGRTLHPALTPNQDLTAASDTQRRMLSSLYQVASIFAEQYAPLDMKKERFQLDLKKEYDKAKAAILANPDITTRQYQDLLASLVASMRDYHVSISFYSTESSKLPLQITGAEGRYFLSYIDRDVLPLSVFPFKMGDELVTFNGQPTAEAVKDIAAKMTGNTAETDLRMAELFLTNRRRARGDSDIPQGTAELVVRSKGTLYRMDMPWDYTPELLAQDVPLRNAGMLEPAGFNPTTPMGGGGFFNALGQAFSAAVHPLVDLFASIRAESEDENVFMIGARKSFVPRLGKILWQSDEDSHFDAYIFQAKDGRKMGYVRIAAYDGDYKEVQEFAKLMAKYQVETDALVIDQVSNPGGSVFYLYALASHLTDKPLVAPRHRLIIGEAEAHQSAQLLLQMARAAQKPEKAKKKIAKDEEEPNASGYPITQKFMMLMVQSAQFILKQFNSGKRFTDLIHISGVADIDPAPKAEERYTKPILLLTNALDFSGGDFFPAILQDNKRATILGVRTAGAGGIVKPFSLNQFGIARLSATTSLAERPNGQPIENLGVTPDIPYDITAKDMRTGFAQYRWEILKALRNLVAPAPAK